MEKFLLINWDVSPIVCHIEKLEVRWYTLMLLCALIVGYCIYRKMIIREKKSTKLLYNILVPITIPAIVCARLVHCLFYEPEIYLSNISKIFIPIENEKIIGFSGVSM